MISVPVFYVFISLFFLVASYCLFRMSGLSVSINKLNLISILYLKDFLLLTFFGVVCVVINLDELIGVKVFGVSGVVSPSSRDMGFWITMYSFVAFPVGLIISNLVFVGACNIKYICEDYQLCKVQSNNSLEKRLTRDIFVCFLLVASGISIAYVFYKIGQIPLVDMVLSSDREHLAILRSGAKIHFKGIKQIKDVVAINLTILTSYFIYTSLILEKTRFLKVSFVVSFLFCFMMTTYNLEKIPFFLYLFGLFLIRVLCGLKIKKSHMVCFIFGTLFMITCLYSLLGYNNLLETIVIRLFVAETSSIFLSIEYFDSTLEYMGINGISNFFSYFDSVPREMYGRKIFEVYNPDAINRNVAGYIVGLFVAEAWALFSLPGVLIFSPILGFFIGSLHNVFLSIEKSPISLAFYAFFSIKLGITGGLSHLIYPIVFLFVLLVFFLIYFFASILVKKYSFQSTKVF